MGQIGSGDCGSGAAGGLGGAIVAEGYERLTYDEFKSEVDDLIQLSSTSGTGELSPAQAAQIDALFEDWRNRGVDLSRVSGAFFAAAAGGDAQLGAQTAANAAENNILPALILVAKLGVMAYTAYELYETGKKIHNLAERYQNGEEISDEELQSAALELGIEAVTGVVTSKFKLLEKIVKAADGILKKTGLDTKVTKLLQKKSENGSGTTTVADSKTSGDNTGVGVTNTATINGKTCVYSCVVDGTTRYVGITNDVARRGSEHLRTKGIKIAEIRGLSNLSVADAKSVEQTLINYYGLGKNGGTLLNKINSISPFRNPTAYEKSFIRGKELLDSVNYQWTN